MADHLPQRLNHLRFTVRAEELPYAGNGRGPKFEMVARPDRTAHVDYLRRQLGGVELAFHGVARERDELELKSEFGLILEVVSEPDFELKYESLADKRAGIELLNLRHEHTAQGEVMKAAIFVPFGKLDALQRKVDEYEDPTKDSYDKQGNLTGPRNSPLLNNIQSISVAALEALWTDPEPLPSSDDLRWFELWIRRDDRGDWSSQLFEECERLEIQIPDQVLTFPDHIVVIALATRQQLESSVDLLNCLSEVRKARPCGVGLTDLSSIEQEEWVDEALDRIEWPGDNAPAVCILDTGVNRGHPLIEPLLSEESTLTVFGDGDSADDSILKHGTPMAGLAAYGDLRMLMDSTSVWRQQHGLESVKLIRSSSSHDLDNYGSVTWQAMNEPESIAPDRARVFCMAVTIENGPNTYGNPSAWSTALDIAAAGAQDDSDRPRVIFVSAGNSDFNEDSFTYPGSVVENPVEDPAQAWNVITVGAYTNRTVIEEGDDEALHYEPAAPGNSLSPYSRTSHAWTENRKDWPIKPDVVIEGGNIGKHRTVDDDYLSFNSLQLLSTNTGFRYDKPIRNFNATSAATALASRVAARILARYPDLWAETVRGLLVHSARWPQELLERNGIDPHAPRQTEKIHKLMRGFGYGVVDENRAVDSSDSAVTFYREAVIQPFRKDGQQVSLNECHLISLPWPTEQLQQNDDVTCTLRITLSYFIEPNPGTRSYEKSQKYRYASHLLGFTPKHKGYTVEEFRSRLHADEDSQGDSLNDSGWALGDKLRRKGGSLIQDVWRGSAADLATMDSIAVFPRAKGWWATRKYGEDRREHNCHERSVRYALIISIETEANLPIYAEVANAITEIEADSSVDV